MDRTKAMLGPNGMTASPIFDEVHERRTTRRRAEFHYTKLHPGEAELIDAQLIRDTCLVGTPGELIERIGQLERAGCRS